MAYPDIDFNVTSTSPRAGILTYTFTIYNNTGLLSGTAYDLNFNQAFAAYAPNASLIPGSVTATGTSTAARITSGNTTGDNTVGVSLATLHRGETLTVSFDLQRLSTAVPGSSTTSTATLNYDNIAGNSVLQLQSTATANTTLVIRPVPEVTETVVTTSAVDTGASQYIPANQDLKPGEKATVEMAITVPEGDNTAFSVVDQLADAVAAGSGGRLTYVAGSAQVVSVGSNLSSLSLRNLNSPIVSTADSNGNGTADQVMLNFGGIRNASDKVVTAADQIVLRLQVQAPDVPVNERGDTLTNTVTVNSTSAATGTSTNYTSTAATVSFDVVEPLLNVTKTASVAPGAAVEAGTEVSYTLTLQHTATSSANAYDLALADLLPPGMTLVAGSLSSSAGTATSIPGGINLSVPTYNLGSDAITLTYRARVGDTVVPGQVLSSAATLNYDSQAGTGGRGDAAASSAASVAVGNFVPTLTQSIATTSLAESGSDRFNASVPDTSVGEVITYRLTATLAEGSQRLVLTDTLPVGLQFVSAQVESIGGNITGSSLRAGSTPAVSGNALTFDFGSVVNAGDNVSDARDQISVLVTARDVSAAAAGTTLTNNAMAQIYAPGGATAVAQAAASQDVEVVRPNVAIAKAASITSGDAGDLVTYTVTLSQAAASSAAAYNLVVTDPLVPGLSLVAGSAHASAGTVSETAGGISYTLGTLALGSAPVTITYQARVADNAANGQNLVSGARLSYATAPGNGTGATGTASSAPLSVSITDTVDSQLWATSNDATGGSQVGSGELVTLRLIGTLGEGTQRLTLAETLPAGLEYVSSRVVSLGNTTGSVLAVGSAGTLDSSTGRVSFNFGAITNPGDNVADAGDQVVVELVARVAAAGGTINPTGTLTSSTPGNTGTTTLTDGDVTLNVVSSTLGGNVFFDANGDGIQGSGEAGIAGVAVQLLDGAGNSTGRSTTTDAEGNYNFAKFAPGSYMTQFTPPAGQVFTPADQGGDDALDSDADPATGRTPVVALAAGQDNRTLDAGFYRPAVIGGEGSLVFADLNGNGIRDNGEGGVANVTLRLLDANGNVVATANTGTTGSYSFTGIAPGRYQVEFTAPPGTQFSAQNAGGNDANDSDVDTATGRTALFTLVPGGTIENLAAGVYALAALGGTVFADTNGNGIQDAGEAGQANITVRLLDQNGNAVGESAITDSAGRYSFGKLLPGTYQAVVTAPDGYIFSPRDQGTDDTRDSDVDSLGSSGPVRLASGNSLSSLDAGLAQVSIDVPPPTLPAGGIVLGAGDDTYSGTEGADSVSGGGGRDALMGNGGDDLLLGGEENDSIFGHDGNDQLYGEAGDDLLHGLVGNDFIYGGSGNDVIEGGNGQDFIVAGSGDDAMQGEGGNDVLQGGAGADTVEGNAGSDLLLGGSGDDHLAGHDLSDTLVGGADNGTAALSNGTISAIQRGDRIYGDAGADRFICRPGDGVDELPDFKPSEGDQLVIYGYTNFQAVAKVGTSTVLYLGTNAALILTDYYPAQDLTGPFPGISFEPSPGAGQLTDEAIIADFRPDEDPGNGGGGDGGGTTDPDRIYYGGPGNDNIVAAGWNNHIEAGAGDDTIDGGQGNAYIDAGSGNNTIRVGGWNNTILAAQGNNILTGPQGNTTVRFGDGSAQIELQGYNNVITLGTGNSSLVAGDSNATVTIQGGNNTVIAHGWSNRITTGAGDDVISGLQGNSIVSAGNGANRISAAGYSNQITTGVGNDIISAGDGTSIVQAGAGNDDITLKGWGNRAEAEAGNDTIRLIAGEGDGTVDGGGGIDTVVFSGNFRDHNLTNWGAAGIGAAGPEGSYRLLNVERLSFADATIDVTPDDPLFDPLHYYTVNPDVLAAGVSARDHYLNFGWKEGRDANPLFDTQGYLAANRDVRDVGIDPLSHYRTSGWQEERDPSVSFDVEAYLAANADVRAAGLNPLMHYLTHGEAEGREIYRAIGPVVTHGFDREFYLLSNPDVAAAGLDAQAHYLAFGQAEHRNPNGYFDVDGYLAMYADIRAAGVDPLQHYLNFGWREGRDPSAEFDTRAYLAANADVAAAGLNPLEHYLLHGHREGRMSFAHEDWT